MIIPMKQTQFLMNLILPLKESQRTKKPLDLFVKRLVWALLDMSGRGRIQTPTFRKSNTRVLGHPGPQFFYIFLNYYLNSFLS